MPLIFSAVIPHSPATINPTAHESEAALSRTQQAILDLEGELYVMQPDTLFVISPHALISDQSFSINLASQFICSYQEFGDADTSLKVNCDVELISKIREYADSTKGAPPVNVITQPELDHGTAVALYHLTQHLPAVKVIPMSLSHLSIDEHFRFGEALRYVAMQSNKRVAFIATAELGHTVSPAGATFGKVVLEAIQAGDLTRLQGLNLEVAESAQSVNEFKTFIVLSGALSGVGVQTKILSNEQYNGRGLVVAQFNLI